MDTLAKRIQPQRNHPAVLIRGTTLLAVALLLEACSSPLTPAARLEPTLIVEPTLVPSVEALPEATETPTPTQAPTSAPTAEPTPTVWPPAFALWSLEDLRSLDGFVVNINERNTVNGQLTERTITIGYRQEPYGAFRLLEHAGGVERAYVINERTYELTASGDWYISTGPSEDLFNEVVPAWSAGKLVDATFAGEEAYDGTTAYHFVLDANTSTGSNPAYQVEGDLYLAREGNYLLYSHSLETTKPGETVSTFELTYAVSSIDQPTEISLPADMEAMAAAADLPFELGLPLPAGSAFVEMIRYQNGIGVDLYQLSTPKTSIEEFLDYYRDLPATDGWTVSHIGHVSLHQDDCEFTRDCVILNKGSTQVILFYTGVRIRAEFDWPRLYSPLK